MLIDFFYALRDGGLKTSITEYLALLEGLEAHVAALSIDSFYVLARTCLVKDETHFERFDRPGALASVERYEKVGFFALIFLEHDGIVAKLSQQLFPSTRSDLVSGHLPVERRLASRCGDRDFHRVAE